MKKKIAGLLAIWMLILGTFSSISYAGTYYTLQLEAYSNQAVLEIFKNRLEKDGIDYYILENNLSIVYNGKFEGQAQASQAADRLKGMGYNPLVRQMDLAAYEVVKEQEEVSQEIQQQTTQQEKQQEMQVEAQDAKVMVFNKTIDEDLIFQGVLGEQLLFFTLNRNWEMEAGSYMMLRYSHSAQEQYLGSTVTVFINQVPVETVFLNKPDAKIQEIEIPIAKAYLKEGINEVRIKTYHRITEFYCDDDINPGNWVNIHKNSFLHIRYTQKEDGDTLLEYPYPYLQMGSQDHFQADILIAKDAKQESLKGALLFSADMGKRMPFDNVFPPLKQYDPSYQASQNTVFIGRYDELPLEIESLLSEEEKSKIQKHGLIKETINPYNAQRKLLMILYGEEEYLLKALQILSNESTNQQMDTPVLYSDDQTWIASREEQVQNKITLQDMGYGNLTLEGERYASAIIDYHVVDEWVVNEDAYVHLDVRYSDVINYDNSSVMVKINGIPAISKRLEKEKASGDAVRVPIPKELRGNSFLRIEILFTLDVPRDCSEGSIDYNVWSFISNKSYLYLPEQERKAVALNHYPYPLIKGGVFNEFSLVIDRNQDLDRLAGIFANLGHHMKEITNFQLIYDDETEKYEEGKEIGNVLFINTAAESQFLKEINNQLWIRYTEEQQAYQRESMDFIQLDAENVTMLQVFPRQENWVYALTSLDRRQLEKATAYLSDLSLITRLEGRAAAIFSQGNLQIIKREEQQSTPIQPQREELPNLSVKGDKADQIKSFLLFIGILLVGIFTAIIVKKRS